MRDRSFSAIAVAAGAAAFAIAGTTPHLLAAFCGARPFWSRFESRLLLPLLFRLPAGRHSVAIAIAYLVTSWAVIGVVVTASVLLIPPVRRRSRPQQLLLAVITPFVVLPLLAIVAPFEPGF